MSNAAKEEQTVREDAGVLGVLGRLSALSLTILGAVYVMGYVVVNGYQTTYLDYSATALQLKHLTAGMLYAFLTFVQISTVAFFVLSYVHYRPQPGSDTEESTGRFRRLFAQAKSRFSLIAASLRGLLLALFAISFVFSVIGMSSAPPWVMFKAFAGWSAINLGASAVLALILFLTARSSFRQTLAKNEASSNKVKQENANVSESEIVELRRTFIEAYAGRLAGPVLLLILLLVSLTSFQKIYGRLKPDYGGGALYRVGIHLQSPGNLPEDLRNRLVTDSWLFLVDKDGSFVYVLRVDKDGNRRLIAIAQSEIKAMEIVAYPPIAPIDAPFFINEEIRNGIETNLKSWNSGSNFQSRSLSLLE